jgi:hypothetical protein
MGNYFATQQNNKIQEYFIEDNGGKPYKVVCDNIDDKLVVYIYESDHYAIEENNNYMFKKDVLLTYYPQKVFVGKSPKTQMTEFSGGYDDNWDGNSVLLYMGTNKYIHISKKISSFDSIGNITSFISLVGNSRFIYSWAVDEFNNYYLLQENVILKSPKLDGYDDPYNYYYDLKNITDDTGYSPPKKSYKIFRNIVSLYCNDKLSTLFYNPFPEHINTYWFENKDNVYIIDVNNNKVPFSWGDYLSLMNEVADTYNFVPLKMHIINHSWNNK